MTEAPEGRQQPSHPLDIAVLGTGPIGRVTARRWAAAGHRVTLGSRSPRANAILATSLGSPIGLGTWTQATAVADVVLLAVAHDGVGDVLAAVGDHLIGKIVIDATNPMGLDRGRIVSTLPRGVTQGSWTSERLPGAHVVRAFTHVMDELLSSRGQLQPHFWGMAVAGDDEQAVSTTCRLVRDTGFTPVDIGDLSRSAPLDPGGTLFPHLYTPQDLRAAAGL